MKKQHLAAASLGALALAGVAAAIGSGHATQAAPQKITKSAPAESVAASSAVDAGGFRASEFAGVSVRERPSQPSGASRGLIGARPGSARPTAAELRALDGRIGVRSASGGWRKEKGASPYGGTSLVGGPLHAEVARRGVGGHVGSVECVPDHKAKPVAKRAR